MTNYKGFKTLEDAKQFQKENGGIVCGGEMKSKRSREYHEQAVSLGGFDGS